MVKKISQYFFKNAWTKLFVWYQTRSHFPFSPLLGGNQTKQKGDDGADVLRGRYFDLVQVGERSAANTPEPTVKLQAAEDT